MSITQKIIKYLALAFAFFIIINIISGLLLGLNSLSGVLGLKKQNNEKEYLEEVMANLENSQIENLKIEIDYSNLEVRKGENFKVESNDRNVKCTQNNNQLTIKEKRNNWFSHDDLSDIIIYIPEDMIFEKVKIETGAGEIYIENLVTKELSFEMGAGKVKFDNLSVLDYAKIEGGAGKLDINSGEIRNLDLDMGVGQLDLTSKLTGTSDIDEGVGKLNINLTDGIQNYRIKVSKGIGSITIDGEETEDGKTYGDGENYIKIDGGIGSIDIK